MRLVGRCTLILLLLINMSAMADTVIRLNTTGQPPLNTAQQDGFMDEVASEAFRRIGIRLKTTRLPAERGLKNSNNGIEDGEMSRVAGLDKIYKNLVRVPEKIMDWEFVAFAYKPISLEQGWSALSGQSVAHINGWKILEKNVPTDAEVIRTAGVDSLFKLLRKKRTDYILYERWGGQLKLKELSMTDVQRCEKPLIVKKMYIYLHRKHKDLVPKLANALAAMKADGSYEKLVKKHLHPYR